MFSSDYPTVSYRRLTKTAVAPKKAHKTDAAFDLYADEGVDISPGKNALVGTGIALDMSQGLTSHHAAILSRSGLAVDQIFVLNAPGLIDTGYRGEIKIILQNLSDSVYSILPAERIAQIVFIPNYIVYLNEVNELSESDRGEKGFGSSGKE